VSGERDGDGEGRSEVRPTSASILVPFGMHRDRPLREVPDDYLAMLTDDSSPAGAFSATHYPAFTRACHREWRRRGKGVVRISEIVECATCNTTTDDPVPAKGHCCEAIVCRRCFPRHVCRDDGGDGDSDDESESEG